MNKFIAAENLAGVFAGIARIPTITLWNRLEGRPRTHEFERALRAEIRDPLWLLTKQWQMGEFQGDDAGSPVFAKMHIETTRLTKYRAAGNAAEAFDDDVPLEAKVERRAIPFEAAGRVVSLDLRVAMGRRWLKLIAGLKRGSSKNSSTRSALPRPTRRCTRTPPSRPTASCGRRPPRWPGGPWTAARSSSAWSRVSTPTSL